MVRICFMEKDAKITLHQELSNKLKVKNVRYVSVRNSIEIVRFLESEKPDVLIIDDRLSGLSKAQISALINEAMETMVILIERINGVKKIREVRRTKDGFEEIHLSEQDLLDKIRFLKFNKAPLLFSILQKGIEGD